MMHIHLQSRKLSQDTLAKDRIYFHRLNWIPLVRTARMHLERLMLQIVDVFQKSQHIVSKCLNSLILRLHNRADSDDTKNMLQMSDRLLVIIFSFTVHKNAALLLIYGKCSITLFQCMTDLAHKRVLKEMAVLSLDRDLSIFDQKCLKHV